jgi:hypothetical protein
VGISPVTFPAAAMLLCLSACGLFVSDPLPPDLELVFAARAEQAADWALLDEAWRVVEENQHDPLRELAALRLEHPESVRLAVFEQDMQVKILGLEQTRRLAATLQRDQPGALNAFLAARVVESVQERDALLVVALDEDEDLVEARVLQLANAAFAGDTEVLADLIDLLDDYPGSAQAWRLLGRLAPLFDRRDLAYRAAATEPWSPVDAMDRAAYAAARRALLDGFAEEALASARRLPAGTSDSANLQAAAFAALGRPVAALEVIDRFLQEHPDDLVAVFNRALLLREYLGRADEAATGLRRFLELEEQQGGADLTRRMQAELWLGQGAGS